MACTSGSVQTVADKTTEAKKQIDKLQSMIQSQDAAYKQKFFGEINSHLASANITDARETSYNVDIKTEYSSEFSLDKIANVVISALKAAVAATDPKVPNPATSPDAIAAYTDLVNTVAEAAKSSSSAAATLSFSMTRLSPGMFAFLYATSVNIQDDDTFGSEAVCTTAVYYRFMQSIDDIKSQAEFDLAQLDSQTLIGLKTLQAALVDDLANGKIDITTWNAKDSAYDAAINKVEERLKAHHFNNSLKAAPMLAAKMPVASEVNNIITAATQKLAGMGAKYTSALAKTQHRIETSYF